MAVDAMGGDAAPGCVIDGIKLYLQHYGDTEIRLFGREEEVRPLLDGVRAELINCPEVIGMEEEPMMAVRRKGNSSMIEGLKDVKAGNADAFVCAGSTGALMLGSMVTLRMIPGIQRPALAPILPGLNGKFLLIDSGANADCQPAYLCQFGLMGSVYMRTAEGMTDPKVGLVNIGVEEDKGNKLFKDARKLMSEQTQYRFCGNLEARDIQLGDVQVAVTDGFTGNVILKYAEGFAKVLLKTIKNEIMSTTRGKLGGLLLKPAFANIRTQLNTDEYGGAPLLGVDGVVVKAHGSSGGYAFFKAMEQARRMVLSGMVPALKQGLENSIKETKQ